MTKYSTVQFTKDFLKEVRIICAKNGLKIGPTAEIALREYISSSLSGSLQAL